MAAAMRDAMVAYHGAEAQKERAHRQFQMSLRSAQEACGPHLVFDVEKLTCVAENQTTTERFAETHRLHVRRDECNDQIIPGRRGHLYIDDSVLCLMVIDVKPSNRSRWEECGGKLWMGEISPDAKGKRVQDVKIFGVTKPKIAIRMCGVKAIRIMSESQTEVLRKAREALRGGNVTP